MPRLQGIAGLSARVAGAGLSARPARLPDPRRRADHAGGGGAAAHRRRPAPRALIRPGKPARAASLRVTLSFHVAIPARQASMRLPGKMLAPIHGKPMLQWVYERARASGARDVLIATDDEAIAAAAKGFGAIARMTSPAHASGTDRLAELAAIERWPEADIVVNVQGDEPLIPPALIRQVAALLESDPQAAIATLATPVESLAELLDPNAVKVV